jgi:hypothetical protein
LLDKVKERLPKVPKIEAKETNVEAVKESITDP